MRVMLQPAFILHQRSYRETSLLLEVFTQDHGRVSLIARGVRQGRSKWRALLQPFIPLLISWQGKTELMTLQSVEPQNISIILKGECLLSGFYLNELLIRLLPKQDPHPLLYAIYQHTLSVLAAAALQEKALRLFEKKLLDEIGYALPLHSTDFFDSEQYYYFDPAHGFSPCPKSIDPLSSHIFSGKSLLFFMNEELEDIDVLHEIKRLMRIAMAPLLGDKPLQSRKLWLFRNSRG